MNRVKKTIIYLLVTAAALLLWYQTTPQYFSKDKLVDAYLRGYHAGPAKETLLEYESQSGRIFRIVECTGEPDYAFEMERTAGLWAMAVMHELTMPEDREYDINYSDDMHILFGRVQDDETAEIRYKFFGEWYNRYALQNREGVHTIEDSTAVDEKGIFYKDYFGEMTGVCDDHWNGPFLEYIKGYDSRGNLLWSYDFQYGSLTSDQVYIGR